MKKEIELGIWTKPGWIMMMNVFRKNTSGLKGEAEKSTEVSVCWIDQNV